MSQTIRDVLVKIAVQTDATGLKLPAMTTFENSLKRIEKYLESNHQSLKSFAKTEAEVSRQVQQSAAQSNKVVLQNIEANKQLASVFGGVATAAMQAVRGLAFLTAANEEDYQAALKSIAQYQGYFDLLSAGINGYKRLADVKKMMIATIGAEIVAENALAAARTRSAVAGMLPVGAVGARAASAALPLAGAALRTGLGSLGVTAAGYGMAAGTFLAPVAAAGAGIYAGVKTGNWLRENVLDEMTGHADWRREVGRMNGLYTADGLGARHASGMAGMDRRFRENRQSFDFGLQRLDLAQGRGIPHHLMMGALDKQEADQRFRLTELQQGGGAATSNVEKAREIVELQKSLLEIERKRIEYGKSQQSLLENEIQLSQKLLAQANAAVQAAQSRFDSEAARFAQMESWERERLQEIATRVAAGTQTDAELRELHQSGFGGERTQAMYRDMGKEGLAALQQTLGTDTELKQALQQQSAALATAGEVVKESSDEVIEVMKKIAESEERLIKYAEGMQNAQNEMARRIKELEDELAKARMNQAKLGGGGGGLAWPGA